jgi:predicted RecA/RadA family phage recombinase
MAKNYESDGNVLQWTNGTGAAVASGQLVKVGNLLAIALVALAAGETGSVAIEGVFRDVPKVTGNAWAQGEKLIFHVANGKLEASSGTAETGDVTGGAVAWLAAGSSDAIGVIKLTPGNTTVT